MAHSDLEVYLRLPVTAIGKTDVGRLIREVEMLDQFIVQSAIRQPGLPMKIPKTSKVLDEAIQLNELNMLHADDRQQLLEFLRSVYATAPNMHMSFSADPSPFFMQRLMTWVRQEIHPLVLVQVGLQPNIGAGCVVMTKNKYFDLSLRNRFFERRDLLIQKLRGPKQ